MPGYDVVTVEPIKSGLVCPHCQLVLRDAMQTLEEGLRLCQTCYKEICLLPNRKCSDCGIAILASEQVNPDRAVRRDIDSLLVKCRHTTAGCPWQGLLKHLDEHMAGCRFRPVPCPNSGCQQLLAPSELEQHASSECGHRRVVCQHCRLELTAHTLEDHTAQCPSYPLDCERCQQKVEREKMEDHRLNFCSKVECLVPSCRTLLLREGSPTDTAIPAARDHLADPDTLFGHVQNISFHLVSHHKALASLRGQLGSIVQERSGHGQATTAAVEALGSELAQSLAATQQQLVALEGRVEGLRSGQDKNRVEELQRTVRGQTERIARLEGSLESLRQQSERQSWQLERAGGGGGGGLKGGGGGLKGGEVVRAEVGTEVGERSRMAQLEGKIEEVERQNALLKVHMSELELQLQASLASTHNGAFLWRIPEVSRRKRDALEERITSIYSPPFYTGRNGYKMCIRAYLNGDGIGLGTYLSIFFVLMKGEYDPLLKWPFENKVSLILVDQNHRKHIVQTFKPTPESSSFQRPRADMNVASGCPQFSKLSVLDDKNYVKEDVMYIKCIVDTSRIFHP